MLARPSLKTVNLFAWATVGLSLVLMAVRGSSAFSFTEPLQLTTSGFETEFIYSIWKYINDLALYTDQTKIPFTATFYNWMFYAVYGEITGAFLRAFSLADDWLPTITRLITLAGGFCGTALAYYTFIALLKIEDLGLKLLSMAFAIYLFFGPLPGFFAITTRPETWAIVFDIAAIFTFLKLYRRRPLAAILLFCAITYAAWAFKQIFFFAPGAVGLFLLLGRDWKHLAVLIVVMWGAWGLTLLIGGLTYTQMLFYSDSDVMLSLDSLIRSVSNFSVKFLPGLAGLAAVLIIPSFRRATIKAIKQDDVSKIAALGLLVTAAITVTASLKVGSAEHYFLPLTYYIALLVLAALAWMKKNAEILSTAWAIQGLGWAASFFAVLSVLLGFKGVLSVRDIHEQYTATRPCLQTMVSPAFLEYPYLSLPWMRSNDQHFVVHFHYFFDRAAGIEMEGGGIGGLIDQGYFASLALDKGRKGHFDGSGLKRYRSRPGDCAGLIIYDRD